MATKDHTLCVTCHTELPPETEIHYFAQSPLFPSKDDLSFGDEMVFLINHMAALFDVVGNSPIEEEETVKDLGKLGYEVAQEARRRLNLWVDAQPILSAQLRALRKRLGEEEVV